MNKIIIILLALFVMALTPAWAIADTVEGSVQGFTCVTQGKICPAGKEDPVVAAERLFVVLTKDDGYYFVPNVDRAVLARHINEQVRVRGTINTRFHSIVADEIEALKKGAWITTWRYNWQRKFYIELYGGRDII